MELELLCGIVVAGFSMAWRCSKLFWHGLEELVSLVCFSGWMPGYRKALASL